MAQEFARDFLSMVTATRATNDARVMAILPTCYLEAHITELVRQRMPGLSKELGHQLFDLDKPLYPIAVRINVARALGAIDTEVAAKAHKLVRIRNRFAHNLEAKDFNDPVVAKLTTEFAAMPPHIEVSMKTEGGFAPVFTENTEGQFLRAAFAVCIAVLRGNAADSPFEFTDPQIDEGAPLRAITLTLDPKEEDAGGP